VKGRRTGGERTRIHGGNNSGRGLKEKNDKKSVKAEEFQKPGGSAGKNGGNLPQEKTVVSEEIKPERKNI